MSKCKCGQEICSGCEACMFEGDGSCHTCSPAEPDATERASTVQRAISFMREFDHRELNTYEWMADFLEAETPRIKADLEAENALLKKKLEMALQGIEHYGDESFWDDPHEDSGYERATLYNFEDEFDGPLSGYELARRIKAEIEGVK